MLKKGGVGFVLVAVSQTHKTSTGYKGLDGKELITDNTFQPERHANNSGVVIQTPLSKGKLHVHTIPVGFPPYGAVRIPADIEEDPHDAIYTNGSGHEFLFSSDIQEDVQIGEEIIFKPRILDFRNNYVDDLEEDGIKKKVYKVPYDCIYAIRRKDSYDMVGSWTLIDPIYEDWEDILYPTYTDMIGLDGKPIPKPKDQWIQIKQAPEHDTMRGYIKHIGLPLKGLTCDLVEGDKVVFRPQGVVWIELDGKEYMIARQHDLLAKLDE